MTSYIKPVRYIEKSVILKLANCGRGTCVSYNRLLVEGIYVFKRIIGGGIYVSEERLLVEAIYV